MSVTIESIDAGRGGGSDALLMLILCWLSFPALVDGAGGSDGDGDDECVFSVCGKQPSDTFSIASS